MVSRGDKLNEGQVSQEGPKTPVKPLLPAINVTPASEMPSFSDIRTSSPQPSVKSSHSVPGSPVESFTPSDDSPLPMAMIPILFREATLDTPSFRAHCEHLHKQFTEIDQWMGGLMDRNNEIDAHLRPLRYAVNDVLGMFMPPFVYNNVIDQSNMSVVFERYAEGVSGHWTSVMFEARKHFSHIANLYRSFQQGAGNEYHAGRSRWLQQQKLYDKANSEYLALSKKTDSFALRDAAQQVYKYRLRYLKQSLLFCETLLGTQRSVNAMVADALARPFKLDVPTFLPLDKRMEIGHDMHRLYSYAASTKEDLDVQAQDYAKIRADMIDDAKNRPPSRLHADYQATPEVWFESPEVYCKDKLKEKYGWITIKIPGPSRGSKASWVRVWAFLRDGVFGWLSESPSKSFVQEAPCFMVPLCSIRPDGHKERNFCFRIATPSLTFTLQASNREDLHSWLCAFYTARIEFLDKTPSKFVDIPSWATGMQCQNAVKIMENANFMKLDPDTTTQSLAESVSKRVDTCIESISGNFSFMDASHVFSNERSSKLAPDLLETKPMGTSRTVEALVASSYFPHRSVPNAIVGNYGGSVNWTLYSDALSKLHPVGGPDPLNLGGSFSAYPKFYPEDLQFHDMDMRSYFGPSIPNACNEDLLVMVARCRVKLKLNIYSSCAIYISGKSLFVINYSSGLGGFLLLPLQDLLGVQCESGIDHDTVKLTYKAGNTYQDMDLRFYIDSGSLFQRRLQFLFDNCKAVNPFKLDKILSTLQNIGKEHYNDLRTNMNNEADMVTNSIDMIANTGTYGEDENAITFPDNLKLHEKSRDAQIKHLSVHMRLKAQETFPISPKQLFYMIFGDTSPISAPFVTDINDLKWYYSDSSVMREYVLNLGKIMWLGGAGSQKELITTQVLERRDENYFYSVTEVSGICELFSASFRLNSKYIVALTKQGTKLLLYNAIEWVHESSVAQSVLDRIAEEVCDRRPAVVMKHIREHVRALSVKPNDPRSYDISQYGRVRIVASKPISPVTPTTKEDKYIQPSVILQLVIRAFTERSIQNAIKRLAEGFRWLISVSTANFWILVLAGCSVLMNIFLASQVGVGMWQDYWMVHSADQYANALNMSPNSNIALRRAVFSKDVEELVQHEREFSQIADSSNSCWLSFRKLALADPSDYPDQFRTVSVDSGTENQINLLLDKRLDLAMQRNELLAGFYRLEREELELIRLEWKRWVLNEVKHCAEARHFAASSNQTGLEVQLIEYCVPCLEAAKMIL